MATASDLYTHVGEQVKRDAADAMDGVFNGLAYGGEVLVAVRVAVTF